MRSSLFLLLGILFPFCVLAQHEDISGTVIDSLTKQPLAFVAILVKETKKGLLTDIDGRFVCKDVAANSTLVITYVGYQAKEIPAVRTARPLVIALSRNTADLHEVSVTSGLNPAHRIIRLVQQNRKRNDPIELSTFTYNAYTIAAVGAEPYFFNMARRMGNRIRTAKDTVRIKSKKIQPPKKTNSDTTRSVSAFANALKGNYLFVTESYTKRLFKYPKLTRETILATKVSGIKDPLFASTSSDFQPFGFYRDYIPMSNRSFINPLIAGSIEMYKFNLRQVLAHEKDTTYVISFEPLKGKNFTGLKGMLYINSDGWAIENVIASPADDKSMILSFRLQQKYERVEGHWFPSQLNTNMVQKDISNDSVLLYWDTKTYINNVAIDQPLERTEFSDINFEFKPHAGRQTESDWQTLRPDSLSQKEKATYHAYELLPTSFLNTLNTINKFSQIAATGVIQVGVVDIPMKYFFSGANQYEKFRLGGGIQTNADFSKWFSIGGYGGYGFGDKAWKYGGNLEFTFNRRTNTKLRFSFSQDLEEPGNIAYFNEGNAVLSGRGLRNFYASRMDSLRQWKMAFTTKPLPWFQTDAWLLTEERNPAGYSYGYDINNTNNAIDHFTNTEAGIGLRFTRNERYAKIGNTKVLINPPRTQILFQVSMGLKGVANGELDYTRVALQVNHRMRTKKFGETAVQLELAQVSGNVPYAYLFNTKASGGRRGGSALYIRNSFQTVGLYEFSSNRTASLFLSNNFGNLLFKPKNSHIRPELVLAQNISYGSLSNAAAHKGLVLQAPEKGLFETGVLINNIYRVNMKFFYLGFGAGVFRRYGYYALPNAKDNMAFKFGLTTSF